VRATISLLIDPSSPTLAVRFRFLLIIGYKEAHKKRIFHWRIFQGGEFSNYWNGFKVV